MRFKPNTVWLVALVCSVVASPACAEKWAARARTANGSCPDGAIVNVVEDKKSMALKFSRSNGYQYADFKVNLSEDGSGKAEFEGVFGRTTLIIPPGAGKRQLKTAQVTGICQWLWD